MNQIELLSPVGDFECLKAAVQAGANCVYFGGNMFNARASAGNFNDEELRNAIEYAKIRNVKTNLALNILIKDDEFNEAFELAKKAYEYGIDAIIVQDLGLAKKLIQSFPDLPIHASTQMTIHNLEGVLEAEKLGFKRVVLSRELSLNEIKYICEHSNIEIEVFIHGALCICYSGQCLLSSMIGARSGNRGKCAQPCRLPYELIKNDDGITKLDKGYLLSPKDLCSLELLPELVKLGIKSFKIEGRLKTPEYVATVTRIYRKYIDLALSDKPYVIDENDKSDLLQVFNRGGFSTGYLENKPNQNLIYKDKSNNIGILIGTVYNYNPSKGYITFKLENNISIGDTISLEKEKGLYNVSELMIQNKNVTNAANGDIVKIGRMKGKISVGDKIYKMSSKVLNNFSNTLINSESKKIKINCTIEIHKDSPITLNMFSCKNSPYIYQNIDFTITSDLLPIEATNLPITEERIKEQINKLGGTPYEFENINIHLDDNLYIPSISKLNQLRRDAIRELETILLSRIHRAPISPIDLNSDSTQNNDDNVIFNSDFNTDLNKISILLNEINPEFDYNNLTKIDRIYIPLKYFYNEKYTSTLQTLCNNFNTFIYMPSIIKDTSIIQINPIIEKYTINGFVFSNISHFNLLKDYVDTNYEIIANYNLNIYNNHTISELKELGVNTVTISPELDKITINNITSCIPTEAILYGSIPVMTTNYCLLSKSNNCLQTCKNNCTNSPSKYFLKDRMDLSFRIIPDSFSKTTTIYNSKKLSYSPKNINTTSIRLDFLDETIEEINNIITEFASGNIIEGKDYTNGNYNRMV